MSEDESLKEEIRDEWHQAVDSDIEEDEDEEEFEE